ncbi:MAG TPA: glycogen debranching N-terminal domain-containing protein, partial [Acidimicrobiales bacterium]|nr:glycogen debranching N-terminal domain-containing protein [Acidimicrobiales bacterium]
MTESDDGPLNFRSESASLLPGGSGVTLVEESSFCLSDAFGDMDPSRPAGLFVGDLRILSRWRLALNGSSPEFLGSGEVDPFAAVFVQRHRFGPGGESQLLIVRTRELLHGAMRETITLRNIGALQFDGSLSFDVGADFADLFAVKEGRARADAGVPRDSADDRSWRYRHDGGSGRGTELWFSEPVTDLAGAAAFSVRLAPGDEWDVTVDVAAILGGQRVEPTHPCGGLWRGLSPGQRLRRWRSEAPVVDSDSVALVEAVRRSIDDLGALRIFDPEDPERVVIAAGAPWFMTLFGRDSLLTSWMTLIVDPELAVAVLRTLARLQGDKVDPVTEEQPGRILHEVRFGDAVSLALGGGSIYYGSIDATPLFVMLLGELRRWGLVEDEVAALL